MLPLIKRAVIGLLALTCLSALASASHFRYGHVTWVKTPGGAPNQVDITLTTAWRAGAFEGIPLDLGDGTIVCYNIPGAPFGCVAGAPGSASMTDLGTFTDAQGEMYRVGVGTYTHTYNGEGPWTISSNNCCRIGSLINASSASWALSAEADLRGNNGGSPVSSLPVILQVPVNDAGWSFALPVADPDADPVTCSEATAIQSGIPTTPTIGANTLTVDNTCTLNWDTTGGVVGDKYAFQVTIEENHPGGDTGTVPLDFILELTDQLTSPTCAGGGNFSLSPGVPFNVQFTGDDPGAEPLTLEAIGTIPAGATFSPPLGTVMNPPFVVDFDWTPTGADVGSAYAISVSFADPGFLRGTCSLGLTVVDDPSFTSPNCGSTINASVGANVNFDVTAQANTGDAGEFVTLDILSALPAGATLTPNPPVVGQPATMNFDWTPGILQLGTTVLLFEATDQLGQSAQCRIVIEVAECFLVLANNPGSSEWAPGGEGFEFSTQLGSVFDHHPVLLDDMPAFALPRSKVRNLGGNGPGIRKFVTYMQVVMYNPDMFPANPEQSTPVLRFTHWTNGDVSAEIMGDRDGMDIWMETFWQGGTRYVRFPFSIDGM